MVQETAGGSVVADEEMLAPEIDGSFVPRLRPQVVSVEIEGGSVIFLEGTASVHRFDRLAAIVLSCFDGSATLDELIADLRDLFGGRSGRRAVRCSRTNPPYREGRAPRRGGREPTESRYWSEPLLAWTATRSTGSTSHARTWIAFLGECSSPLLASPARHVASRGRPERSSVCRRRNTPSGVCPPCLGSLRCPTPRAWDGERGGLAASDPDSACRRARPLPGGRQSGPRE